MFEDEMRDCTVKALTLISRLPYPVVHQAFKVCGRKDKRSFLLLGNFQKVCRILNLEAKQVKRTGSVGGFIKKYPTGSFFCQKRKHAFAVINGSIYDSDLKSEVTLKTHLIGAWLITIK